jgi:hypothetical protein
MVEVLLIVVALWLLLAGVAAAMCVAARVADEDADRRLRATAPPRARSNIRIAPPADRTSVQSERIALAGRKFSGHQPL